MTDDPDDAPLSDLADELREDADRGERDGGEQPTGGTDPAGGDRLSPFDDASPEPAGGPAPDEPGDPAPESPGDAAPLSDLADEVARRRDTDGEDAADVFEEMDAPEIDAEQLWEQLVTGGDDTVVFSERVESDVDRDVRVIPKRTCQGCPYFTDPPQVGCTHDGTDILELVDVDHHKVADCPMVVDEDVLHAGFEDGV